MERQGHWRALARRKYGRRMTYVKGDGPWLVLTKCTPKWRYALVNDQLDAISAANKSCGDECQGPTNHRTWKLLEEPPKKAEPKPEPELSADSQEEFWEFRMKVDGLE